MITITYTLSDLKGNSVALGFVSRDVTIPIIITTCGHVCFSQEFPELEDKFFTSAEFVGADAVVVGDGGIFAIHKDKTDKWHVYHDFDGRSMSALLKTSKGLFACGENESVYQYRQGMWHLLYVSTSCDGKFCTIVQHKHRVFFVSSCHVLEFEGSKACIEELNLPLPWDPDDIASALGHLK